MKRTLFLFVLLLSAWTYNQPLSAREVFLATDGNDSNEGTLDAPWGSLKYAFSQLGAADTLWIRSGTYYQTERIFAKACGTKEDRIYVFAYDEEKPILNWSNAPQTIESDGRGIEHSIGANYWHYRGLEICYCGDNGMKLEGSYCVVEDCVFHHNRDTGLQIGFGKDSSGNNTRNPEFIYGRYNIVINCDSYDNYNIEPGKTSGGGGDADGFAVKLFPGPGNEFHGCRSWMNSDDGWDFYHVVYPIVVHNCWTMKNGYDKGNGNGFKMGGFTGAPSYGAHIFSNCVATDNVKKGFDQNNHNEACYMFNCIAARNGVNYQFDSKKGGDLKGGKWVLRNCVGSQAKERNHKFLDAETCDIQYCSWNLFDNNNLPDDSKTRITTDYSSEYESMDYEEAIAPRQENGNLPLKFAHLKAGSKFIDQGTIIKEFDTKNYSDSQYSSTTSISYAGTTADLGAFEYGIPDNIDYTFVYPENDGSVDDPKPTDPFEDFRDEDGNIAYQEKIVANWYPFQEAMLPQDLASLLSLTQGTAESAPYLMPNYTGSDNSSHPAYTQTTGAVEMPKGGSYIEFTLPSVRSLQIKLYTTGGRDIQIKYGSPSDPESSWKTVEKTGYAKGNFTIDLTALASDIKRKTPITLRFYNHKTSGSIRVTDLYISTYEALQGTSIESPGVEPEPLDMYATSSSLIVYGENEAIAVYNMAGQLLSRSFNMQVTDISHLPQGAYAVVVKTKNGEVKRGKFVKN